MKIDIVLLDKEPATSEGFPLVVRITDIGKRVKKTICRCFPDHYSVSARMITEKHPDYDVLAPLLMSIKLKARKIIIQNDLDAHDALAELFKIDRSGITIAEFGAQWIADQKALAEMYHKKGDTAMRNKIAGNVKSVENALTQFNAVLPKVRVSDLDYETLMRFRQARQLSGNSISTVHLYLRTIRALYNKAILMHKLPDSKPFNGVFDGLKLKSFDSKKKYLDKAAVELLEKMELVGEKGRARDLFLLQFYFGGADLTDIYHLKKFQLKKGRVRFQRGKVSTGTIIDMKVHPKAMAIINRYPSDDEWLFPWRKDVKGYETFRSNVQKMLKVIQTAQNEAAGKDESLKINLNPEGGYLAPKVARHTFANIAKGLMIDQDIIRELMGHQRDSVDNFYKDKHTEKVRDEALFRIIE